MARRTVAMSFGLVAVLCIGTSGCTAADTAPPSGWFGNVYLGAPDGVFDARKSFIVSYRFSDTGVQVAHVTVAYGTSSRVPDAGREYVLELVGGDGRVLSSRTAPDPRAAIVEKEGNVQLSEGLLTARLPFDVTGQKLRLSDAAGRMLAEADLSGAIAEFCRRLPRDPDCLAMTKSRR